MFSFKPLSEKVAVLIAALAAIATLVFDISQPLGVAGGMPYVVLPLLGLLARSARIVSAFAVVGTLLTMVGMVLSPHGGVYGVVMINRIMGIALIWVVAYSALHHLRVGRKMKSRLRAQALTDPLTGLYNRRRLFEDINKQLKRVERYAESFSIIMIDADHFKSVNDSHGHGAGDATLCAIARTCMAAVRGTDIVGRFGGEEFLILLPHTPVSEASTVAERIRQDMRNVGRSSTDDAVPVTLSFGVAQVGPQADTFDSLLAAADQALYDAKRAGRNRVAIYAGCKPTAETASAA